MRTPSTTQLAASLALAFATSVAMAQTSTGTVGTTVRSDATAVRAPQNDANPTTSVPGGQGPAVENQTNVDTSGSGPASFGPGGSFANDSGNSALGRSPGMTSSGTAAGNSSQGLGVGSNELGTDSGAIGVGGGDTDPSLVPGGGAIVDANGQRPQVAANGGGSAPSQGSLTVITTPTLDATVRRAQARDNARRAAGDEPRVIGIAPRTDADLTHQMPDDRIIRY